MEIFSHKVFLVHRNWNGVNTKGRKYDKSKSEKNIFYFEPSSKPNVDIIGITVSMWKIHSFGTIFTSNDIMKIQDDIGNGFGSRERA